MAKNKVELLKQKSTIFNDDIIEHGYKNGIEIEKGVVLNEDYLKKNYDNIGNML